MQILEYINNYQITVEYNHWFKRNNELIKKLPQYRWNPAKKAWIVPISCKREVEELALKTKAEIIKIDVSPEHIEELEPLPELKISLPIKATLRPYQEKGVQRAMDLKRLIIGDEQGLGKTITSISTVVGLEKMGENVFPCIVICPSSTKTNWQREWEKFSHKKAMVLTDSTKNTWYRFYEMGIADVFITNYESMKKFFVQKMPAKGGMAKDIELKPQVSMVKSMIVDESHRCFVYDTPILTNKGWIPIGDIVENKMENLLVASWCFSENKVSFNKISNFWKNEKGTRKLHRISAGNREIVSTEDHKIFVEGYGWKEALFIRGGENLFTLQEKFLNKKTWKNNCELLFQKLCLICKKSESRNSCKNGQKQKDSSSNKNLQRMRKVFSTKKTRNQSLKSEILRTKLFCKMENETAGGFESSAFRRKKRKASGICYQTNEKPRGSQSNFQANERKQSNVKTRKHNKNATIQKRTDIYISRWKRQINRTTKETLESIEFVRGIFGIRNQYQTNTALIQIGSKSLQSGYCFNRFENSNRSGRKHSQVEKVEIFGQTKNRNIKLARVESNTVLESGNNGRFTESLEANKYVYDLEIEGNHNYFANGILVSNCKDTKTQQAKIVLKIAQEKNVRILLTGTPVVNKPIDLFPQLAIIGRLQHFGGGKVFRNRYCEGGRGAANLKELNYLLNKYCFFRREKKDVAKDLPEKQRQTILCDITTRKEYNKALHDFTAFLEEKGCTDLEIARKMRGEIMVKMGELKKISARGKLNEVFEFIKEVMESGEKLILFAIHHEIVDSILKEFPKAVTVTGRDSDGEKQRSIDAFQNNPNTQLIVCNIKAAGVGITLTASSRVAFIEYPWTYADCVQCEDRAHRIGQVNNVMCTYFLGQSTIDEDLYRMIQEKRHVANTITGATDKMEMSFVDSIMSIFNKKVVA